MHLLCMCFILYITSKIEFVQNQETELECDFSPCAGNRPDSDTGCCLGLGDSPCSEQSGISCDVQLGYECAPNSNGRLVCQGRYNLRAIDVQYRSVTVEWEDFKPENYTFEYSIMESNQYTANLSSWTRTEHGLSTRATIHNLMINQLYFIRVGVWDDPFHDQYRNISETIIVKTKAGCQFYGDILEVGATEEIDGEACKEICECGTNGEMACEPIICHQGQCQHGADIYANGESFDTECESCVCSEGDIECYSTVECPAIPENCPRPQRIDVPGTCCPNWTCSTDCVHNDVPYQTGEEWTDGCHTKCMCSDGITNCFSLCEESERPRDCPDPISRLDDRGCCTVIECRPSDEECIYNDRVYSRGDVFLSIGGCSVCECVANSSSSPSVRCLTTENPQLATLAVLNELCPDPQYYETGCNRLAMCEPAPEIPGHLSLISLGEGNSIISFNSPALGNERLEIFSYAVNYTYLGSSAQWQEVAYLAIESPPILTSLDFSNMTHPAIRRIRDRIFLTMEKLNRSGYYAFKLEAYVQERPGPGESRGSPRRNSIYPTFATLADGGWSCQTSDGRVIDDGVTYKPTCRQTCLCHRGEVICDDECQATATVIYPSSSCPRPVLEESQNGCCPAWTCYPELGGCIHGNILMRNGERIRDGCEQYCRCINGSVICEPVCPETVGVAPRTGCRLQTLQNQCCPTWACLPDRRPFQTVAAALRMEFRGPCVDNNQSFKSSFARAVIKLINENRKCPDNKEYIHICEPDHMTVDCGVLSNHRRRRETRSHNDVIAQMRIYSELNGTSSYESRQHELTQLLNTLMELFRSPVVNISVEGSYYAIVGVPEATTIDFRCPSGYMKVSNTCVEAHSMRPVYVANFNVSLRCETSDQEALTLAWRELSETEMEHFRSLYVEYREFANGTKWQKCRELHPSVNKCTVDNLRPAVSYNVRLVAQSRTSSWEVFITDPVIATTKEIQATRTCEYAVTIKTVDVTAYTATIAWDGPRENACVSAIELSMTSVNQQNQADDSTVQVLANSSQCVLSELSPSRLYTALLRSLLRNGTIVTSAPIHFKTNAADNEENSHHTVGIVSISVVAILALIMLIVLSLVLWGRTRGRRKIIGFDVAFENRIFGVHSKSEADDTSMPPD